MAELVGLVSSTVALVGVAGNVAGRILKLKNFLSQVYDVPDKLSSLMREIEILEPVLFAMEREFNKNTLAGWDDTPARLSLEYCYRALLDLNVLLDDLSKNIDSPKKLKKGKATMKVMLGNDTA